MSISDEYDGSGEPGPNIYDEMWNEICSLREDIKQRDAKIAELEKLTSELIAQAACAREQGAREMAEFIAQYEYDRANPLGSFPATYLQLWREGRGK